VRVSRTQRPEWRVTQVRRRQESSMAARVRQPARNQALNTAGARPHVERRVGAIKLAAHRHDSGTRYVLPHVGYPPG
jgi:ribosomal protein L44E